jgi:hypothetical protein
MSYDRVQVASTFVLFARSGYWRADPGEWRGYTVRGLIAAVKGVA